MSSPAYLEVIDVSKEFAIQSSPRPFRALDSVSVSVGRGELVALLGPSGCGKSTLLEIAAGLQQPTSGEIWCAGKRVSGPGPDRSVVFQSYALFPWRSVLDNVAVGLEFRGQGRRERRDAAMQQLELVGLADFAMHYVWQLSGGMQQRVSMARALAVHPDVLLMDEPFGALDAITREQMQELLLGIRDQTRQTTILVTHSVDEAVYMADRVIVMSRAPGRVVGVVEAGFDHSATREQLMGEPAFQMKYAEARGLLNRVLQEVKSA